MVVSFQSAYRDVAMMAFAESFDSLCHVPDPELSESTLARFTFTQDAFLLDARHWIADAIGCGLILRGSVEVL